MTGRTYRPRADLYVRSLCPSGAHRWQEEIVERLNAMDETGHLAGFSISVWGERVPCDGRTPVGESTLELIETFEAWSDRAGTSLSPFFGIGEVGSMLADETRTTVELPMGCLAEYCDDRLAFVTPCIDDGTVYTIADRVDALEPGSTIDVVE